MALLNEKELIEKLRSENERNLAFSQLVRLYQERVYWLIRRMVLSHDDANDLTQDVFVKIFQHISSFKEESSLFTWIYRIATNEALRFLRRKRTVVFLPLLDIQKNLESRLSDDNYFSGDQIERKLQKAMLTLPDKQRLVFQMKYYDNFKYEEMSKILGTSVGALKASYHHAIKKIESYLEKN